MNDRNLIETSKFLSLVLRHEPERVGLVLDEAGWVGVDDLLEACSRNGQQMDRQLLEEIVATIEKLGMADSLKSKLKPTITGEEVNDLVVKGGAQFGVLPLSEILAVKGAELGGMFPTEVQSYIVMAAGASPAAKQGAAARELIKYLMSPDVLSVIKAKGMERVP